eukprot:8199596-Pyramimonas_sp.AAC.1
MRTRCMGRTCLAAARPIASPSGGMSTTRRLGATFEPLASSSTTRHPAAKGVEPPARGGRQRRFGSF